MLPAVFVLAGLVVLLLFAVLRQERKRARLLRTAADLEMPEQLVLLSRMAVVCKLSEAIAHEINQPLTAMLVNAEAALRMLTRDPIEIPALREALDDILASNRHALRVVQRMRTLLRNAPATRGPIDLNETAQSALALARSDLTRHRVRAEIALTPQLGCVQADRVQIEQVILNLIVNACEAMADTPVAQRRLCLATRDGTSGEEIEFAIADHGTGIEPSQLERVFQPFVTTKPDGLGLGLSICRSIIETHGGRIWVENGSRGVTFRFTLPRRVMGVDERPIAA